MVILNAFLRLTAGTPPHRVVNQSVDNIYPLSLRAVNHLVEENQVLLRPRDEDHLDDVFHALSNRTRRALVNRLADGPARVTELARPHGMSLAAISKHLFGLERAGLIQRKRDGSVQSCVLNPKAMTSADEFLATYRRFWSGTFDKLADFVERPKGRR
jgi:DNA-binding transcriptional ArsR family regulator